MEIVTVDINGNVECFPGGKRWHLRIEHGGTDGKEYALDFQVEGRSECFIFESDSEEELRARASEYRARYAKALRAGEPLVEFGEVERTIEEHSDRWEIFCPHCDVCIIRASDGKLAYDIDRTIEEQGG